MCIKLCINSHNNLNEYSKDDTDAPRRVTEVAPKSRSRVPPPNHDTRPRRSNVKEPKSRHQKHINQESPHPEFHGERSRQSHDREEPTYFHQSPLVHELQGTAIRPSQSHEQAKYKTVSEPSRVYELEATDPSTQATRFSSDQPDQQLRRQGRVEKRDEGRKKKIGKGNDGLKEKNIREAHAEMAQENQTEGRVMEESTEKASRKASKRPLEQASKEVLKEVPGIKPEETPKSILKQAPKGTAKEKPKEASREVRVGSISNGAPHTAGYRHGEYQQKRRSNEGYREEEGRNEERLDERYADERS